MTSEPHANPMRTPHPNSPCELPIRTSRFEQGRFQAVSSKGGFKRFRARAECARARARHAERVELMELGSRVVAARVMAARMVARMVATRVVAARMVAARMVPTMELARVEQLRLSG